MRPARPGTTPRRQGPGRRDVLAGAAAALLAPTVLRAQDGGRLVCRFDGQIVRYRLMDSPTVRDLLTLLPARLTIRDFSTNEKIIHLPRRLDEGGFVPFADEAPGDLCYFLGWGNLALFHGPYRFRDDLIRLGQLEGPVTPLLHRGTHPAVLTLD